ncbi:alkaline phosphatase [Aureimonas endophytica]|uniref:Alkaline phosphatase n=1 Tax=Aureimonas endophytica TaxID=2027858 RepID=A0A916ZEQ0_9HYPH|nr:DedA family protein [Aureimonas endophytica]GGD92518.1 alkaline phosphatase [Aureimonas endophytica]
MDVFVRHLMETLGPFGIALLMFLENVFPPIPSEIIMPLAGYQAAVGEMSIAVVILAGMAGSLLGILPWYYLGYAIGEKRIIALAARFGRWLTMTPEDVETADKWFRKWGYWAVFLGRLVPTVRTLISVPAGLARMPFWAFLAFSALGTLIWTGGLALAGYLMGQRYDLIEGYIGPVSNAVIILAVAVYLWRVVTFKPSPRAHAVDLKSNEAPHRREASDV